MQTQNNYDYIIIGAGCAGLSLAYRLLKKDCTVCILESQETINHTNKIWSFWDTYKTPFNKLIKKKWSEILIKNNREQIKINCNKYNYQSLDSHDFNNYILEKINKSKYINIKFSSKVINISKNKKNVSLSTDKETYSCNHIFDSRPNVIKTSMWQQFFGAYIKSEEDIFNSDCPTLMDFSNDINKFHFNYILPFSEKSALIESTYFSKQKENEMLDVEYINQYMSINHKNKKYNIEKIEFGSIPMDTKIDNTSESYITKIGSYSGATRASTGYTFINIQRQTENIAKIIPNIKSSQIKRNFHPLILRKMDSVFLNIISRNPNYMKYALMKLFKSKKHDSQIRFLSDIPNLIDILKIIFFLPKIKFLIYALGFKERHDK